LRWCQTRNWDGSVLDKISRHQLRTKAPTEADQDASQHLTRTGFARVALFENLERGRWALCPLSTYLLYHGNTGNVHPALSLCTIPYDNLWRRTQHSHDQAWVLEDSSSRGQGTRWIYLCVHLILVTSYATSCMLYPASTNAGALSSGGAPCLATLHSVATSTPLGPVPIPSSLSAVLVRSSTSCSRLVRPSRPLF
jgi:hypothetical protein